VEVTYSTASLADIDDGYYFGVYCQRCMRSRRLSLVKLRQTLGDSYPVMKVLNRLRCGTCQSKLITATFLAPHQAVGNLAYLFNEEARCENHAMNQSATSTGIGMIPDIARCWALGPWEFNNWRATNDLPILLSFFKGRLPGFQNWLDQFRIGDEKFCRVVPTSELFVGVEKKVIYRESQESPNHILYEVLNTSLGQYRENQKRPIPGLQFGTPTPPDNIPEPIEFIPYFAWAKNVLRRQRFFADRLGSENKKTDIPVFNSWRCPVNFPNLSRAILLGTFQVLKLGALQLEQGVQFGRRNLDFVDLDLLTIRGGQHGSWRTTVRFSSCRRLRIEDAELNFVELDQCVLDDLVCERSRIYDMTISHSTSVSATFRECRLRKMKLVGGTLAPDFDRCDLIDVDYVPARHSNHLTAADSYRRIRAAYQYTGRRHEVGTYFYLERAQFAMALGNPYRDYPDHFPGRGYGGRIRDLYTHWEKQEYSFRQCLTWASQLLQRRLWTWAHPKTLLRAVRFKIRFLTSLIEWAVWGFGERPWRIFVTACALIAGYASVYILKPESLTHTKSLHPIMESIYFSVVTFTTLGYGDILPKTDWMRMICASEALFGAFTMGLFVVGVSNKSRY
jgi:hypothetical protein